MYDGDRQSGHSVPVNPFSPDTAVIMADGSQPRLIAILSADIAGYARLVGAAAAATPAALVSAPGSIDRRPERGAQWPG